MVVFTCPEAGIRNKLIFQLFDSDGDGEITGTEIVTMFETMIK